MTKKILFATIGLLVFSFAVTAFTNDGNSVLPKKANTADSVNSTINTVPFMDVYDSLHLNNLNLAKDAYQFAIQGFQKLILLGKVKNPDLLTIVDFSQPSTKKRMYIIDLKRKVLLEHSLVAHGRNTGELMARAFSNTMESNQSSLGFYVTSDTYQGKHGLSLRLDGMEKNINDNARERAIVIHGADYATEGFCKSTGYLGRSHGCPAVPAKTSKIIINTLGNGSCLFIYSPDQKYLKKSALLS